MLQKMFGAKKSSGQKKLGPKKTLWSTKIKAKKKWDKKVWSKSYQ